MSAAAPLNTPPHNAVPNGAIDKVFAFVDKPWKIAAVVMLATTGLITFTLWEVRATLMEAVVHQWIKPRLERARFTREIATQILNDTKADIIQLAEISLSNNLIRNIAAFRRDVPNWHPQTNPRPIFYANRDPQFVIDLIEGKPICQNLPDGNEDETTLAALGMRRRCFIAVPPVLGLLVGGVMLAWREPLSAEAEAGAARELYQIATELASW
jgi:hypothetical protein